MERLTLDDDTWITIETQRGGRTTMVVSESDFGEIAVAMLTETELQKLAAMIERALNAL